jgi:sucrose-6-phosphate hydrolase SacC (GH32 family)
MYAEPVKEIEKLYKKKHSILNEKLTPGNNPLSEIKGDLFDIKAKFNVENAEKIGFSIRGVPVVFNSKNNSVTCKDEESPCKPIDGKIKLRLLVDRTSIEIFINDGRYFMPMASIPDDDDLSLKVFCEGGDTEIISLEVNELNSAW